MVEGGPRTERNRSGGAFSGTVARRCRPQGKGRDTCADAGLRPRQTAGRAHRARPRGLGRIIILKSLKQERYDFVNYGFIKNSATNFQGSARRKITAKMNIKTRGTCLSVSVNGLCLDLVVPRWRYSHSAL